MKRRTIALIAVIVLVGFAWNGFVSWQAQRGLRVVIDSPTTFDADKTFSYIGPSTWNALAQFKDLDCSIRIVPGDWFSNELRVTHTAFIKCEEREIWLRLRLSPFGPPFDIVGYTDKKR